MGREQKTCQDEAMKLRLILNINVFKRKWWHERARVRRSDENVNEDCFWNAAVLDCFEEKAQLGCLLTLNFAVLFSLIPNKQRQMRNLRPLISHPPSSQQILTKNMSRRPVRLLKAKFTVCSPSGSVQHMCVCACCISISLFMAGVSVKRPFLLGESCLANTSQ